jgi:hypothetical protein
MIEAATWDAVARFSPTSGYDGVLTVHRVPERECIGDGFRGTRATFKAYQRKTHCKQWQ